MKEQESEPKIEYAPSQTIVEGDYILIYHRVVSAFANIHQLQEYICDRDYWGWGAFTIIMPAFDDEGMPNSDWRVFDTEQSEITLKAFLPEESARDKPMIVVGVKAVEE